MRTALIAVALFVGLINCAYSAPQPQPEENTEAVLQELQSVLEQGGASTPAPTQFLCTKSGSAEAEWLTRKHVGTALKIANAAHRAWNDQQARDQWLTRKHVGTALKVANAAHRAWNDQQARDQWLTRKHVGTALKVANAAHRAWNDQQARDQWLTRKHVGTALKVANAAHRAWNNQQLADAQGADQELADDQGTAAIVNFSCTPVKVNSNGEVTFLDLE